MRLDRIQAFTFDCYGTLIDWETGLQAALRTWAQRGLGAADRPLGDAALLDAFAAAEARQQAETPGLRYAELLGRVLARIGTILDIEVRDTDRDAFGASVGHWPAFPDSAAALKTLKRHGKLIVLSNVDRASFAGSATRLGNPFDAVFTAEDIGCYKPDPRTFDYLLARLDEMAIAPGRVLHVAQSLFHDHMPAKRAGLATCWIDRRAGKEGWGATPPPPRAVTPDLRFERLADLAAAVQAARR